MTGLSRIVEKASGGALLLLLLGAVLSGTGFSGCARVEPGVVLEPMRARADVELSERQVDYQDEIYPFFDQYCFSCHGKSRQKAEVNLFAATDVRDIGQHSSMWTRVLTMLESGQMPPEDEPQPMDFDREDIAGFIEAELDASARAMTPDPGRVTWRRLNRQEYDNTIRDLLGVEARPADSFPVDDSGYGFDNIGDVLTLSPLLMEKYLAAAEEVAGEYMARELAVEPGESALFVCGHGEGDHSRDCAKTILRSFASRAYRRPATRSEVRDLTGLVSMVRRGGDSFEDGIQLALEAVLISPNFLFRIEQDRRPKDPGYVRYVNDYELASRLSYFLWSSMPDDALFALAADGRLREPKVLAEQVERMIADEKAWAFVENFAGQWLELRNLGLVKRDRDLYPAYRGDLRRAMRKESELFFDAVFREDQSILRFLDADFTFVNETLAEHYEIPDVSGKEFRRVALDGGQRGGVLTQASILTLTSFPKRTSPVLRGAWVLENILGSAPPPPPDDIPELPDDPEDIEGTFREQLEMHRSDASCASCHSRIDPLGFGLENYDAIGRWRTEERELPVDSSGVLPTGEAFSGSAELRAILLNDPDDFVRCFTEKVLIYALGRGVEPYDRPALADIIEELEADEYGFHGLVRAIVSSVPFQLRRGEGGPEA